MALITIGDLKLYLSITTTSEDNYLMLLRTGTEAAFKRMVGWEIEATDYTEYYDGNWTPYIALRQPPVNSIASVYLDPNGYGGQGSGAFPSTTLLVSGTDYYFQKDGPNGSYSASGLLVKIGSIWPGTFQRMRGELAAKRVRGQGNIKVAYNGGYNPVPADVKQAIFEACKQLRAARKLPGIPGAEGLSEYNYSILAPGQLEMEMLKIGSMAQIVATYRKLKIG